MTDRLPALSGTSPLAAQQRLSAVPWSPPPLRTIEDTGLNLIAIADLALKVLYFGGEMTATRVCELIALPYSGVVDGAIEFLKREKFIEIKGQGGIGDAAFKYLITSKGTEKAREVLERSQYAGPAPVTLDQYIAAMKAQNRGRITATPEVMKKALGHLVISEKMYGKIGPAVNSGK